MKSEENIYNQSKQLKKETSMYVCTYFTKTDVLHFKEDFFVSKRRLKYLIHSFSAYFALSHNTNSLSTLL